MSKKSKQQIARERQEQKAQQRQRNMQIATGLGIVAVLIIAGLLWRTFSATGGNDTSGSAPSVNGEVSGTFFEADRAVADLAPAERENHYSREPEMVIDGAKSYQAVIQTDKGDMVIDLFDDEAPITVNNFVYLASQGFYDGVPFHRVMADFMAQGGDPTGTGRGGPGYEFQDETDNGLQFDKRGLLAMANAGPGTNGSQFFITFVPTPHLNGNHTIFGELSSGDDVLSAITLTQGAGAGSPDIINRIDIYEN